MDNLFAVDDQRYMPLAARMRPRSLDEYVGQSELLGEGTLLRKAIEADKTGSLTDVLNGDYGVPFISDHWPILGTFRY